jgi:hypothetical protein
MNLELPKSRRFSFTPRPVPIPGDLRIAWRVSLIVIMLGVSRSNRASLAKLYVLNHAARSLAARGHLDRILTDNEPVLNWHMRVEPAFARAVNFVVGEGFAQWVKTSRRVGLQLTARGLATWKLLDDDNEVLVEEKQFLKSIGRQITETFVSRLLDMRRD